ncbi:predicted protein [Nematostella vectensis]|uniref:Uncharacterized protein n=1 Tax=Nematostella vectensis TaxID=45351 RepID=A7SXI4_NEMVE|nr:predicted protein [Nematostella vectensis]|eukprot:XP_001623676.1 predicted protein [Nematostella vectensis]
MCSNKKRTGIILVIFGIVAVVVGILVGQFITRRVKQGLDDQICINSKDHTGYDSWVSELLKAPDIWYHTIFRFQIGASESSASIYFWHIKNKNGFLHKGETPQFEERGPYVYKTTTEKIDVSFDDNGHVTYKKYSQQTFDADATAQACPQCKESDQMTVLNLGYLGAVAQAGGDMGIALAMVPPIVGGYILQLNATLGSGTYHYLGRVEPTNTTLTLDFGHWLSSQSQFASLNTSYNSTEMMGLYNALTNSSLLLPTTGVPCKDNPIPSGCGLVTYVPAYMKILKAIATAAGSNVSSLQAQAAGLKLLIDKITCPVENMICFKANDTLTMTALLTFITSHLPMFVMAYFDNNNIGLLTTRPQKELTLGYVMDKLPMPPLYPNGTPVPGFLTHHTSKEQARLLSKSETFHTCKSSGGDRFTWAVKRLARKSGILESVCYIKAPLHKVFTCDISSLPVYTVYWSRLQAIIYIVLIIIAKCLLYKGSTAQSIYM